MQILKRVISIALCVSFDIQICFAKYKCVLPNLSFLYPKFSIYYKTYFLSNTTENNITIFLQQLTEITEHGFHKLPHRVTSSCPVILTTFRIPRLSTYHHQAMPWGRILSGSTQLCLYLSGPIFDYRIPPRLFVLHIIWL